MVRTWTAWVASASIVLLVGAGCGQSANQQSGAEVKTPVAVGTTGNGAGTGTAGTTGTGGTSGTTANAGLDAKIDAAFNAAVSESDASTSEQAEENADVNLATNDSTELNAYGTTYDQSKL